MREVIDATVAIAAVVVRGLSEAAVEPFLPTLSGDLMSEEVQREWKVLLGAPERETGKGSSASPQEWPTPT